MIKKRLFIDMDGTLAEFKKVEKIEELFEEFYFLDLDPHENVIEAVSILNDMPDVEVFILSAVLDEKETPYALKEKNLWLDKYLPDIDNEHRIFCPCGVPKVDYVPNGICENDYLLDDYTKNLVEWEPPGRGIKLLNDINDTNKTWQSSKLRYDKNPYILAEQIEGIIFRNEVHIEDNADLRVSKLDAESANEEDLEL